MILDTHAWLLYATGAAIGKRGRNAIDRARTAGRLSVAAVTLWEVALLAHQRKLRLLVPPDAWFREALARTEVSVIALDAALAVEAARLVHVLRDPADCQIVATALRAGTALVTRDARILEHAQELGLEVVEI